MLAIARVHEIGKRGGRVCNVDWAELMNGTKNRTYKQYGNKLNPWNLYVTCSICLLIHIQTLEYNIGATCVTAVLWCLHVTGCSILIKSALNTITCGNYRLLLCVFAIVIQRCTI